MTHPEDVDLDLEPFRRMAAGQLERYSVEKRFIHKDGHHVWARLNLSLVRDADGRSEYEIAVIENIKDRKQVEEAMRKSEARFRGIFANAAVGIALFDAEHKVLRANSRFCAIIYYAEEELRGLSFSRFTHPDDLEPDMTRYESLMRGEVTATA